MGQGSQIVVIFDGECSFCKSTLDWLQQKVKLSALPFQSTDLSPYGLTRQQCQVQVYAICENKTFSGAAAISFLLHERGNTFLSATIKLSGGLGRSGYRWVASHRRSLPIRVFKRVLDRSNAKHRSA